MGVANATVADIVQEAGISVGTFYGRFADKDALIEAFCERYLDDGRRRADVLFAEATWPRTVVVDMARAFVMYRVRHYQRNRRLLYAIVVHMRAHPSLDLRRSAARIAAHFHQLVVTKFAEQADTRWWRVDGRSIACALTLVEAVLKDLYLFNGGGLVSPKIGKAELIDYLTALFANCLSRSGNLPHDATSAKA
jgi:AcrR family transcriptional regulator